MAFVKARQSQLYLGPRYEYRDHGYRVLQSDRLGSMPYHMGKWPLTALGTGVTIHLAESSWG